MPPPECSSWDWLCGEVAAIEEPGAEGGEGGSLNLLNLDRLASQQAAAIGDRWDGIVDSLTAKPLHAAASG